ncbi:MAG: DUF2116 family Zn-ribbon domain-containing protein [Promethearchaeota archaeon]
MSKGYKFKKYQDGSKQSEIFPHKHCSVCSRMIPPDQEYCSDECRLKTNYKKKTQKKKNYRTFGIIAFVIVAVIIVMVILG